MPPILGFLQFRTALSRAYNTGTSYKFGLHQELRRASMTPHVVVVGAGVVGLTTALSIRRKGFDVTILASELPSDQKSIRYTSPWAGAHVATVARSEKRVVAFEAESYGVFDKLAKEAPGCVERMPQYMYYPYVEEDYPSREYAHDFRLLKSDELRPGAQSGAYFTSIMIDAPRYISYLLSLFLAAGGHIAKVFLQHVSQAAEGGFCAPADAVVICAGLGARTLGGIEDKDMYPVRGQTVVIRAPWVKTSWQLEGAPPTYIIPRPSGEVICGGTRTENDWHPTPRPETSEDILKRCLALCPELAPPTYDTDGKAIPNPNPTVEDLRPIIIEEGCGLRPARKGGIRLGTDVLKTSSGEDVPLVYNYGHGGYGFQGSWGSANAAVSLLEGVVSLKNGVV